MRNQLTYSLALIVASLMFTASDAIAFQDVDHSPANKTERTTVTKDHKDDPANTTKKESSSDAKTNATVEKKDVAVTGSPQATSGDDWEFSVTPYLFLSSLDGTVGALGRTTEVRASFSDIFDHLDFALMGTFEARKGNWMFIGDAMYIKLSGQRATPSILFSDIDVETSLLTIEPQVGYRVVNREKGSIDLIGGARLWRVKNHITFQPLIGSLVDVEDTKTWIDPVVGARATGFLSPRTFVVGRFDIGGFGIASDFTGQAFGGLGFQLKPRVALIGGYRYLFVDYKKEGFTFNAELSGVTIGARFNF